jgi:hypothetical protein
MRWQDVVDWSFRIGLYRGVRVNVPSGYIEFDALFDGQFLRRQDLTLNPDVELARWLMQECDGPWRIRARRNKQTVTPYLAFARVADAVMFRLMMP